MRGFVAGVLLLVAPGVLGAQRWEPLGTRRVSFDLDRDGIDVAAREGAFTAIRIEVEGGTLEMYNIEISFRNGETWSPPTRVVFRDGAWSRTIDLPGPARLISRVDFWYRSRMRRGEATVRLFGRSAPAPTPESAAPPTERR